MAGHALRPRRGRGTVPAEVRVAKTKPKAKATRARPRAKAEFTLDGSEAVFGAAFFARLLPRLVRSCPCPETREPACLVHLADGNTLDVVEVLAVADRFVVLAVFEGVGEDGVERSEDDVGIEAIPYALVLRVSVRRGLSSRAPLGFHFPREEIAAATAELSRAP